jgi:hypothetical protein
MLDDAQEVTRFVYLWYVLTSPQSSLYPELRHNCDIQILLEYTWMIPKVGKDQIIKGHLAWANGDTTGTLNLPSSRSGALLTIIWHVAPGYGMHADFVNGQVRFRPSMLGRSTYRRSLLS